MIETHLEWRICDFCHLSAKWIIETDGRSIRYYACGAHKSLAVEKVKEVEVNG